MSRSTQTHALTMNGIVTHTHTRINATNTWREQIRVRRSIDYRSAQNRNRESIADSSTTVRSTSMVVRIVGGRHVFYASRLSVCTLHHLARCPTISRLWFCRSACLPLCVSNLLPQDFTFAYKLLWTRNNSEISMTWEKESTKFQVQPF